MNYIKENKLIQKSQSWLSMTTVLTFKLTFVARSRLCVLDSVKILSELGENHTVEKLNKPNKRPHKPNLFLDCIIKMLLEDMMKISYTLPIQQGRKDLQTVISTFSKKSPFGVL